jgi:hypothetical protein
LVTATSSAVAATGIDLIIYQAHRNLT